MQLIKWGYSNIPKQPSGQIFVKTLIYKINKREESTSRYTLDKCST